MGKLILTGVGRLSYLYALEQKPGQDGKPGSYQTMFIFPKSDKATKKIIDDAVQEAYKEGKAILNAKSDKMPPGFKTPLHDGDEERPDDAACANSWYFNASSSSRPEVVDRKGNPILDPDEIYSGMYARISLNVKAYNNNSKGITAYLGNIQKVKDGPRLDGRTSAQQDFNDGMEWDDIDDADQSGEDDDLL